MDYSEDDLIPISALQHYVFCPRQCALIHVEQAWAENALTAEGRILHDKVHKNDIENRPGVRIVRGLRLRSFKHGIVGQADVVEFQRAENGVVLPGATGLWQPYPVEFKRGKLKIDECDEVQLCAQALCLEEMLGASIKNGAFFYGQTRRRTEIVLSEWLRQRTEEVIAGFRNTLDKQLTPQAHYQRKCNSCSLYDLCLPKTTGVKKDVAGYLSKAFEDSSGGAGS